MGSLASASPTVPAAGRPTARLSGEPPLPDGSPAPSGLAAAGLALGASFVLPAVVSGADSQGCERVAKSVHPGGPPADARSVVMAVPVAGSDGRVVMGAYWDDDHWSDRITDLLDGPDSLQRLRARYPDGVSEETQAAYRAAFDCVQQAVTEETPASP